jgi:uncharacterized protein
MTMIWKTRLKWTSALMATGVPKMSDPTQPLSLLAMLVIGFLGSGHCVGMCGGIATGLGFASTGKRSSILVLGYNLGRISSYAVAGALVALVGFWGTNYLGLGPWLRLLSGVILLLMAVYLSGWWRSLLWLEKLGGRLWQQIQPLGRRLMPVTHVGRAYGLGLVWGWLPCGLVYSALAYAATAPNSVEGGMMMAAFGLGTAPSMIAGGAFSNAVKRFFQGKTCRLIMALLMMAFGMGTIYSAGTHISVMSSIQGNSNSAPGHLQHH